jgi:hypothetical protein
MTVHRQKNPCPDCRHCQWCSDDRCRLCLASGKGCRKQLSIAAQIALFEQLNSDSANGAAASQCGAVVEDPD